MATVTVHCPGCDSRHGLSPAQREQFRCQSGCRVLPFRYSLLIPR
ncbi:IS1 family transposase [Escherichia albertii]|nr:hypothetical protein CRH02_22675 [Escherichia albertii]HBM9793084.1 hypothetical protein [Escherichia albertii]